MASDAPPFNLVDEPWIPCVTWQRPDARVHPAVEERGLEETLVQAHTAFEVLGDTPLETVSIIRLLLAILHRSLDVSSIVRWQAQWEAGRFPEAPLRAYLAKWRGRFNLFDAERPFYQTPSLDLSNPGSIAKLLYQADNNPTLFDHTYIDAPPALTPARAARCLVAIQAFDTPGMKTGRTSEERSSQASPLVQSAVVVFRGPTLFHTLMLNLHRYSPDVDGMPWQFERVKDLPAWERSTETTAADRSPAGYCDLLTWQSRRVRLEPLTGDDGVVTVRRAVLMRGESVPTDFERRGRETMVAFKRRREPRDDQSAWYPLGFTEDRAAWRDSLALFTAMPDDAVRVKGAGWLADLMYDGALDDAPLFPVELFGLRTAKAKCLFWRHERLSIPRALLVQPAAAREVANALDIAEQVALIVGSPFLTTVNGNGKRIVSALATIAECLVRLDEESRARSDLPRVRRARALAIHLSGGRTYWAGLMLPFQAFLAALPADLEDDGERQPRCRGLALADWRRAVRSAADAAYREIAERVGVRGNAMKAVAVGDSVFRRQLRQVLEEDLVREGGRANDGPITA